MREREGEQPPALPEDPSGIEEPHDVLAAEEFGIGTRDERYPADPSGIEEPHDVLAAEEFAMPSPADRPRPGGALDARAVVRLALLGALLALILARRARR